MPVMFPPGPAPLTVRGLATVAEPLVRATIPPWAVAVTLNWPLSWAEIKAAIRAASTLAVSAAPKGTFTSVGLVVTLGRAVKEGTPAKAALTWAWVVYWSLWMVNRPPVARPGPPRSW